MEAAKEAPMIKEDKGQDETSGRSLDDSGGVSCEMFSYFSLLYIKILKCQCLALCYIVLRYLILSSLLLIICLHNFHESHFVLFNW